MIKGLLKLGAVVAGLGIALDLVKQHEEREKDKKDDKLPPLPKKEADR